MSGFYNYSSTKDDEIPYVMVYDTPFANIYSRADIPEPKSLKVSFNRELFFDDVSNIHSLMEIQQNLMKTFESTSEIINDILSYLKELHNYADDTEHGLLKGFPEFECILELGAIYCRITRLFEPIFHMVGAHLMTDLTYGVGPFDTEVKELVAYIRKILSTFRTQCRNVQPRLKKYHNITIRDDFKIDVFGCEGFVNWAENWNETHNEDGSRK